MRRRKRKLKFEVEITLSAEKDLKKIDPQHAKHIYKKIMEVLPDRAHECELLTGEYKGQRKFEVWPYRVRFIIEKNIAKIVRIRHRKEIYRIK